jgi:hypothetical protein
VLVQREAESLLDTVDWGMISSRASARIGFILWMACLQEDFPSVLADEPVVDLPEPDQIHSRFNLLLSNFGVSHGYFAQHLYPRASSSAAADDSFRKILDDPSKLSKFNVRTRCLLGLTDGVYRYLFRGGDFPGREDALIRRGRVDAKVGVLLRENPDLEDQFWFRLQSLVLLSGLTIQKFSKNITVDGINVSVNIGKWIRERRQSSDGLRENTLKPFREALSSASIRFLLNGGPLPGRANIFSSREG